MPFIVSLDKIIERIRVGKSQETINVLRKEQNKEKRNTLKANLPSILFAGEFTQRNSNSLKKHSGLMVVDFDGYPSDEELQNHLAILKQNKHFVTLFISPSGNGIKGVVKIPNTANKETHPKYFKAFEHTFSYEYFDKVNSNVDRVCFESYDPNIYVNYDAVVFEPQILDNGYERVERIPLIPITDEDKIIQKIMNFNWKKGFVEGERNAFVFDIASAFCEFGVSEYSAIGYIQNNVTIGDFSDRECETAIKSAYRSRSFGSKYFEDYQKIDHIKHDLKKGKKAVIENHKINDEVYDKIAEEQQADDFWFTTEKDKTIISSLKYKRWLEVRGFAKYFPAGNNKSIFVKIKENIVDVTSVEIIKDLVLTYLLDKKEYAVYDHVAKFENMFSEKFLLMLETIELKMLQDTADKSYIGYQNGVLEISKDSVNLIDYTDVGFYVWNSHIIKRNFEFKEKNDNDYKTFISNISNNEPLPTECTIGYLLSTYKNRSNNKAVILNDEVISEAPEGGTGKGVFFQGIAQIRRMSVLNGKNFDSKKSFAYQTVNPDCQIILLDDVKKNYDFEDDFSIITEGITLERKNMDAIKLDVQSSPKLAITTNYAIRGEGNSHDRRRHEIEIAQYYSAKLKPFDEFGKELFDDWSDRDFLNFDNYMVQCIQIYMANGLIKQNAKNLKLRKFIIETAIEFNEFACELPENERLFKTTIFENFTTEYIDFKKWLTRKKFNIWVQKYATFIGAEYLEGNTNGQRWFIIQTDKDQVIDQDEVMF